LNYLDCANRGRYEPHEILKGVAGTAKNDDSKLTLGEVLLELKISIARDEHGEAGGLGCV
jgi:hypothetical protein